MGGWLASRELWVILGLESGGITLRSSTADLDLGPAVLTLIACLGGGAGGRGGRISVAVSRGHPRWFLGSPMPSVRVLMSVSGVPDPSGSL